MPLVCSGVRTLSLQSSIYLAMNDSRAFTSTFPLSVIVVLPMYFAFDSGSTRRRTEVNMSKSEHSTTPIRSRHARKPLYISKIAVGITIKVSTPATATPRQTSPITLSNWNSGCLFRTALLPRHSQPQWITREPGNRSCGRTHHWRPRSAWVEGGRSARTGRTVPHAEA
jgi:hypothetical protein